ncbi:MAG TPA: redoxin family protein [Allosphingosinicella sp.]|uniref:redoxin family protein n=1 Tax=Allosphingosinicella sp. TaxID=2823234 RepID=UPI002ED7A6A1
MKKLILWLPLAVFAIFIVTVAMRLGSGGQEAIVRSKMVGQKLPEFTLPAALEGRPSVKSADYARGEARVINIFASWCVPCIAEAPQLLELEQRGVPIDAIAIRDKSEDIEEFLRRWGDPYRNIGSDVASQVQFALGSSGVPETFVVDGSGTIRYQHIGDIKAEDVPEILAAYEAAK